MEMNKQSIQTFTIPLGGVELKGRLYLTQYMDGSPALQILDDEGPETLSVNLSAYGLVASEGRFYVRDYGQYEGLADELSHQKIASKIGEVQIGHGTGWLMQLEV